MNKYSGSNFDDFLSEEGILEEVSGQALIFEDVEMRLKAALDILIKHDEYLLQKDVNERSISHRLALYLQELFEGWNVDCEYNKRHEDPKRIMVVEDKLKKYGLDLNIADTEGKTVFPDIIVHRRGANKPGDNLLVIEMKKTTSRIGDEFDLFKLESFKEQLGYSYAVFIKLKTGTLEVGAKVKWIQ